MKNNWFSPKEITAMCGMPATIQGVHKKARREGWLSRRKAGVQGAAVEYCMINFSQRELQVREDRASYHISNKVDEQSLKELWCTIYDQLSAENRRSLIATIVKHGVDSLVKPKIESHVEQIIRMLKYLNADEQKFVLNFIEDKSNSSSLRNNISDTISDDT